MKARRDVALALRANGERERRAGDTVAARRAYEEAVAVARDAGEPLLLAHTIRHLGDVYRSLKEPSLAQPCLQEALEIYRLHPEADPLDLANAIRSLALLLSESGKKVGALPLWEEARRIYEAQGIGAGVDEASRWIGLLS